MIFVLKYKNIMEIIDTPNPNARKIQTENSLFEDVQKCKEKINENFLQVPPLVFLNYF